MKSHQANPAELAALAAVPQAPFPLTPPAQALRAARLAALKRKALEEEEEGKAVVSDSVTEDDAEKDLAADGISSDSTLSEGAALEAIAPAPLPEMSGLDTLLAQAGPAATGGGGAAGAGIPIGAVVGGAVVLVAAAASGGGGSDAPAPAPAPAAPPNQPASISTSEVQRAGKVHEDADGDYEFTTIGNNAITALKVTDPDGGADLAFRAATAEELQGKYGMFSFDATSGIWSYTLDNDDPDTQGLMGNSYAYDYLTVYSADGTASTVIEVTVEGHLDQVQTSATVNQGDTVLVNLGVDEAASFDNMRYWDNGTYGGNAYYFSAGGFVLFTAYNDATSGGLYYYAQGYDEGTPDHYDQGYGYIPITVSEDGSDGSDPVFDGTFGAMLTEGTPGTVSFSGSFADADDDGGIYTLALYSDAWEDGHFTLNPVDGITILGNGTSQVAMQGTLLALNNYFDDGEVLLTIDTDESAWNNSSIDAYLVDDDGNMVQTFFNAEVTHVGDGLPMVGVFLGDGDYQVETPVFYIPATGTPLEGGSWELDDFNGYIRLYDEEADYSGSSSYAQVTISVGSGWLSMDSIAFDEEDIQVLLADGEWSYDLAGNHTDQYQGVQEITLRSYYTYDLEDALRDIEYTAPEAFPAGTSDNLSITLTDADDNEASVNIALTAAAQNQSPYFSIAQDSPFLNFTIVDNQLNDGESYMDGESYATAQIHEDQHISFNGLAINDPDAMGSQQVYVYFYAYEYQYESGESWNGIYDDNHETGLFYVDDAYTALVSDYDDGYIEFVGSIDEINAMLAAGALTYAPPPDYDAVATEGEYSLAFEMYVDDMGNAGYGDASGTLYIAVDMIGSEDPVFILGPAQEYVPDYAEYSNLYNMLDGEYVFDAEFNGNGSGGELTITNVTIKAGTGTGTLQYEEGDGDWRYYLGEGDESGDVVVFDYTISDGTSTFMNTLELNIFTPMDA